MRRILGDERLKLVEGELGDPSDRPARGSRLGKERDALHVGVRVQPLSRPGAIRCDHSVAALPGSEDARGQAGPVGHDPDGVPGLP